MITLCAATQGAQLFFHVFGEVFSLSLSLILTVVFTSAQAFGNNLFEYTHQVKDFHLFVFTSQRGEATAEAALCIFNPFFQRVNLLFSFLFFLFFFALLFLYSFEPWDFAGN